MLRVLGVVEIDGQGALRSGAQRILLSALALDAGHVVFADRLAELIWRDEQPENPTASLQSHVSRLRKVLPAGISVASAGAGYRLDAQTDMLDVALFDAGFERVCAQPVDDRLDTVEEVSGLWRGEPFAELDDPRATAEAARLHERMAALGELGAESLLVLGRAHEAIAELEAALQNAPLRERLVELLMRAYVAVGRKSDALAAYQDLRGALVEQLGLDPGPELRELEQAILTEGVVAERSPLLEERAGTDAASVGSRAHGVEVPISSFLGRDDDLERVERGLGAHRIVTIVGPGGEDPTCVARSRRPWSSLRRGRPRDRARFGT